MSAKDFTALELAAFEAEARNSQGMREYIDELVMRPDAAYKFAVEIRKTMINELDPRRYPETAGRWPLLRKEFRKQHGLPARGLGKESGGSSGSGAAIASAIAGIGSLVVNGVMMKYQMDMARKRERKAAARAREAKERAEEREAEMRRDAAARISFLEAIARRTGTGPVSNAQYDQAAKQQAEENTVNAVTQMTRDEVAHQQNMDREIAQREKISPVVYAAPAAVAVMALR